MDIHRCRFIQYPSSAINSLAFSHLSDPTSKSKGPSNLRLAVGRANGDIELWNPLKGAWYQESIFRGGKDRSIEGLVWTQDPEDVDKSGCKIAGKLRLFSIGYSTVVTEWDFASGRPARHSSGNYGEIWCMAAQPKGQRNRFTGDKEREQHDSNEAESQIQNIAVGCADGAIVLLSTAEDDLRFSRILARPSKKRARVLSITFQNRHTIIAGHADSTIRIYDIRNTQPVRSMTLVGGPMEGPKETLVWSVKCTGDGIIVAGDSSGTMSFWDGKNYTLLQRIKSHEADILDIVVSADGQTVFSGGMDRRTTLYKRTESGQTGEKLRWAKAAHQRFHKHDVKTMATFETKSFSVLASGGLDTAPIIVPIRAFGREHHRTLSIVPHQPILKSAPRRRLVVSWWNREIRIWKVLESLAKERQTDDASDPQRTQGRRLVAKIALQGEETISSVDLSSDGTLLAVSTMASLRFFHLKLQNDNLKVQKVALPPEITMTGARSIHISPDQNWLAVIKFSNNVQLHRITESQDSQKDLQILPKAVKLRRLIRDPANMDYRYGTLEGYDRSISCLSFSADSRILAVADISGFVDSWVLEGYEDLTQAYEADANRKLSPSSSDEDDSDANSEQEEHTVVIFGQGWIRNPSASLLIKLPAAPLVFSFRPVSTSNMAALTDGSLGIHPTRHTPHPHSHDLPHGEDRLFALTAENQIFEFNILSGKLTAWSRRNPSSSLPQEFRDLKDRAMGIVWDVRKQNERIWLYGVSWLWMFDLTKDLPVQDCKALAARDENSTKQLKRKRDDDSKHDESVRRSRHDTGAGSKIARSQRGIVLGSEIRKIKGGEDDKGQLMNLELDQSGKSEEDDDLVAGGENDSALVSLRRSNRKGSGVNVDEDEMASEETRVARRKLPERPSHWCTFKYRPILGVVPIGGETDDAATSAHEGDSDEGSRPGIEVALVERPLWDLDMPPQYFGNQEWNP